MHHDNQLFIADLQQQLSLGAGRLDHDDLGRNTIAIGRDGEIAGPDAVMHGLPFAALAYGADRPVLALRLDPVAALALAQRALEHIH